MKFIDIIKDRKFYMNKYIIFKFGTNFFISNKPHSTAEKRK